MGIVKENLKQKNESVLTVWQEILGSDSVITDIETISYYGTTTFKTNNSIVAVLKPNNKQQVQQVVRIAQEYKIPLYPISKGNNWGYGSRVPAEDNCAVISLEKMNSITEFNEEMAYIIVEPGVTFQQVYDFLREKNSNLIAPGIGSTKNASLIGNALERGIGKGVYGDRLQFSCNMEVVLPNGEIINTGFGNIKNATSKNVYKWGLGPSIDGMFSQSNFGIITSMTFWLNKKPKYFQAIFYTVKNDQLEETIEALKQLRLEGTLNTTSTLANSYRILSMQNQFPYSKINGDNALPAEYLNYAKKSLNNADWAGDDALLSSTKQIGKARAKRVKQLLGKAADKVVIIDNNKATLIKLFWWPIKAITGIDLRQILYFFYNSFYLGKPMEKQLVICYFRKKKEVPANIDIDRDKCGFITISPSIPFEGKHIRNVLNILEPIYKKYQFEPNMGLNFMSDRGIAFVSHIIYDRETPGHDEKAMECYKEMMETLLKEGYPPYRLGIQSMENMISTSKEYVDFIKKLKQSIDPNNIISPSHYGI